MKARKVEWIVRAVVLVGLGAVTLPCHAGLTDCQNGKLLQSLVVLALF